MCRSNIMWNIMLKSQDAVNLSCETVSCEMRSLYYRIKYGLKQRQLYSALSPESIGIMYTSGMGTVLFTVMLIWPREDIFFKVPKTLDTMNVNVLWSGKGQDSTRNMLMIPMNRKLILLFGHCRFPIPVTQLSKKKASLWRKVINVPMSDRKSVDVIQWGMKNYD